jgi:pimeloyl-ACP methyl ester carboxylesterase
VSHVLYLHGLWGNPCLSPALRELEDALGTAVVAPTLPGFDGAPGWEAPRDHLGWLTVVWDELDTLGVLPCPVIGASVGGMLAAELAIFRPEAVARLALLGPLGIWDPGLGGDDEFAAMGEARLQVTFAGEIPAAFREQFADRGPGEAYVARAIAQVAAASLTWPFPDRGLEERVHRITCPTLVVWGEDDRVVPAGLAERWPATERVSVPGAGHLVEWDAPSPVASALARFLAPTPYV